MSKLIEIRIDDLTIPYKTPNGNLNIFLNIENIDLVEIRTDSTIKIQIDNIVRRTYGGGAVASVVLARLSEVPASPVVRVSC